MTNQPEQPTTVEGIVEELFQQLNGEAEGWYNDPRPIIRTTLNTLLAQHQPTKNEQNSNKVVDEIVEKFRYKHVFRHEPEDAASMMMDFKRALNTLQATHGQVMYEKGKKDGVHELLNGEVIKNGLIYTDPTEGSK